MCSWSVRSIGNNLGLQLVSEVSVCVYVCVVGGQSYRTEPLIYGILCYLQVDEVKIELHVGQQLIYEELLLCGVRNTPIFLPTHWNWVLEHLSRTGVLSPSFCCSQGKCLSDQVDSLN